MSKVKKSTIKQQKKYSIEELEAVLENDVDIPLEILPNGEVRTKGSTSIDETGGIKPITMREDIGGEY